MCHKVQCDREFEKFYNFFLTKQELRVGLVLKKIQDSPSHRIFGRIYGVLNIDKNKNNFTICM